MMQFNMYHHFTVDEHLIRTIGLLSDIERGSCRRAAPALDRDHHAPSTTAARSTWPPSCTTSPRAAIEDHSHGRRPHRARARASRFGLNASGDRDRRAWLVEHHLLMSTIRLRAATSTTRRPSATSPISCRAANG